MGVALDSVRECSRCGDVKQLVAFANYKGRDGEKHRGGVCKICRENMASKDQEAMRAWRKNYNTKNRSKKATADAVRRAEAKAFVDAYKSVRSCADCGRNFPPVAMDFDHVRGSKVRNVASLVSGAYRLELIKAEIEKCEVVCAVCHRIRTSARGENRAPLVADVPRARTAPTTLRQVFPKCPRCESDSPRKYDINGLCVNNLSCRRRCIERRLRDDRLRGVGSLCGASHGPRMVLRCVLTEGHDGLHVKGTHEWGAQDGRIVDTGKRPFSEREWNMLRMLVRAAPDQWLRTRDMGGSNGSWHHEVLRKFVRLGWAERRKRSLTVQKGSYVYIVTEIGRSLVLENMPSSWREAYEVVCREAKSV